MDPIASLLDYAANNVDYKDKLAEYLIHKSLDKAIGFLKGTVSLESKKKDTVIDKNITISDNFRLKNIEANTIIDNIIINNAKSYNWCKEVTFQDLQKSKNIKKVFIDLDIYLTPKRLQFKKNEKKYPYKTAIKYEDKNHVILGAPGAGKTTLLKDICYRELSKKKNNKKFILPLLFRIREFKYSSNELGAYDNILLDNIAKEIGIEIQYDFSKAYSHIGKTNKEISRKYILEKEKYNKVLLNTLANFFEEYPFLILLDGFDELPTNALKKSLIKEIQEFALILNKSKFLLTSRTGEFHYNIENSETYEICPLTKEQVQKFTKKWLNKPALAQDLYTKIVSSPYFDISLRPLNLAHLCALYERNGDIPEKPKSIYKKILFLLLEEWNEQRQINRISRYTNFTTERKLDFLTSFSFELTTQFRTSIFTKEILQECYFVIHSNFDLPEEDCQSVIDEIESHNGIFLQTGYEEYEFSHKSLQEYLSADYIINLGVIPHDVNILKEIPEELAVAVSLSTKPSEYLYSISSRFSDTSFYNNDFFLPFFNRLLIEKPDFNKSIFIAFLISEIYYQKHIGTFGYAHNEVKIILDKLLKNDNIYDSFKLLANEYDRLFHIGDRFNDSVYIYERRTNQLDKKAVEKPLPIKIHLTEYLYKKFFKR